MVPYLQRVAASRWFSNLVLFLIIVAGVLGLGALISKFFKKLAGKDVETVLSVDGKSQGKVSLKGSTRAIRAALASCGGA